MKFVLPLFVFLFVSISQLIATNPTDKSETNSTTKFTGIIIDAESGEPVTGAKVELTSSTNKLTAYSDFDGLFSFDDLEEENWNLLVSFVSYKTTNVENLKILPDSHNLIVTLQP